MQCYSYPNVKPKRQVGAHPGKGPAGTRLKEASSKVAEAKVAQCLMVSDSRPSTVTDGLSQRIIAEAGCVDEDVVCEKPSRSS